MVIEMKRALRMSIFSALSLLVGCKNAPALDHLVGTWTGPDGAHVVLRADKTFSANSLPYRIFDNPVRQGEPISGKGYWKLAEKKLSSTEVWLDFNEESGKPSRREVRIIVSGSNSSIGLYQWIDQEGGPRYEFVKK